MHILELDPLKNPIAEILKLVDTKGKVKPLGHWQGTSTDRNMKEVKNVLLSMDMYDFDLEYCDDMELGYSEKFHPGQPWAGIHFDERVREYGPIKDFKSEEPNPMNPPPSNKMWANNLLDKYSFRNEHKVFDLSYPERFNYGNIVKDGIRFKNGTIHDLPQILIDNPNSRSCVFTMHNAEDITASVLGARSSCSISWNFFLDDGEDKYCDETINCNYTLRSCDALAHIHNDLYFMFRLADWIATKYAAAKDIKKPRLGEFNVFITSLHLIGEGIDNVQYRISQLEKI